ncbi:SURF1 family protein [Austwickia sp. TVS 96-490-7B]|uniref:SURF1 family protein n=1 Tax=Austwickia sp. TVS 96-490-7B TaxID=2830843 RepID=UPI001C55B22E|nr:SURF1 family protein [Austwickia sp. TVS 96-490-7B]
MLALVVVVVVGFSMLGRWQWDTAHERGVAEATDAAAALPRAPLTEVLPADGSFPEGALDRKVVIRGRYDAAHQVIVPGRRLGDREGYWVITAFHPDGPTGGRSIPVLRGFVDDPTRVPEPPQDMVTLEGVLAQSEPSANSYRPLPEPQMQTVNVPALLNKWGTPLYSAFVFLTAQEPRPAQAPAMVAPPTPGETSVNLRNLGYALQWFFFAAFAVFMWWRMVREEHRHNHARAALRTAEDDQTATGHPEGAPTR